MPVEITDFCWKYNLQRLQNLPEVQGCEAKLRHNADGTPYVTDNKNYIVDLYFKTPIKVSCARHVQQVAHSLHVTTAPGMQPACQMYQKCLNVWWLPCCCCGAKLGFILVHGRTPRQRQQQSQRWRVS